MKATGLRNKVVIITGAAAATLPDELRQGGGVDAFSRHVDVADRASVGKGVNQVMARWGRIDVPVDNAGILRDAQLVKRNPL